MKFKLIFLLAVITLAPSVSAAQKEKYVGYRHKGVVYGARLPNGVKDLGGGLLSNENYGVTRYSKNGETMLWLERIISFEKNGIPKWEVKDVLFFGKLSRNHEFLFSYSSPCTENGGENLDLIVLARFDRKTKTYTVERAWMADLLREIFEEISTENIVCDQEN
jgi:hypothetical protein